MTLEFKTRLDDSSGSCQFQVPMCQWNYNSIISMHITQMKLPICHCYSGGILLVILSSHYEYRLGIWILSLAVWKSIEASSTIGKHGNNIHNQSSLFEEATMPSDKEIGYCDGETDVRQEWLQLRNSIQQTHSCCSRPGSKLWETEVVRLAQHLLPPIL